MNLVNDITPVITDVMSINSFKSKKRSKLTRSSLVIYGPISVRRRHTTAPTLATGRRSKDTIIEGEDAIKREIRRMKNRESARNLKKLRDNIEHELENQVNQLESEQQDLLSHIHTLQIYKQYLEEQYRLTFPFYELIARTTSAILLEVERRRQQVSQSVSICCDHNQLKQEPRSPSPQWQLLFRI